MARILITILIPKDSLPRPFTIYILPFVDLTIFILIYTSIRIDINSFPILQIINPVTRKRGMIWPTETPMPILHIIFPRAIIISSIGEYILSLSTPFIMLPITNILITIIIVHSSQPLLIILIP